MDAAGETTGAEGGVRFSTVGGVMQDVSFLASLD
jgi:hypothetical protein